MQRANKAIAVAHHVKGHIINATKNKFHAILASLADN